MNKQSIQTILLSLLSLLVAFTITFAQAEAQDVPFDWEYINVSIDVQTNGDMLVAERQKYVFKSNYTHQRYRYIALDKVKSIQDVTVEENDDQIPSETGIENNQLWIRWQHPLNPPEAHTFLLKYRVVGGLQTDEQNTQVYWKAIFAERKAPVRAATVLVRLPKSLADKAISFKNFGTPARAEKLNSRMFKFTATKPILPQQELEVKIAFPAHILNLPLTKNKPSNSFPIDSSQAEFILLLIFGILFLGLLIFGFTISPLIGCLGLFFLVFFILPFLIPFYIVFPIPTRLLLIFVMVIFYKKLFNELYTKRKCPQCKTLKLNRTYQVLVPATTEHSGKELLICHCQNCSYHAESEEVISKIVDSDGGGGGGGGG